MEGAALGQRLLSAFSLSALTWHVLQQRAVLVSPGSEVMGGWKHPGESEIELKDTISMPRNARVWSRFGSSLTAVNTKG